jgi:hypothetical protein
MSESHGSEFLDRRLERGGNASPSPAFETAVHHTQPASGEIQSAHAGHDTHVFVPDLPAPTYGGE